MVPSWSPLRAVMEKLGQVRSRHASSCPLKVPYTLDANSRVPSAQHKYDLHFERAAY